MNMHWTADRFRIWFMVAVLAVITLSSLWLLTVMRHNFEQEERDHSSRNEPDYYVEHFEYIRLMQGDKASYHLTGEKLTHQPKDDNFRVTQPLLNSFQPGRAPLAVRADRAMLEQKNSTHHAPLESNEIHLYGNVIVERPQSEFGMALKANSEYLLFQPDLETIKTDRAVSLQSPNTTITAIGMHLNNRTQQLELLSHVEMHTQANLKSH